MRGLPPEAGGYERNGIKTPEPALRRATTEGVAGPRSDAERQCSMLDEPCSAIDPPTRAHLLQVMRQQADRGQTLLVSSHDWGKALDSYDRVLVINKQLVADGTPSEVRSTITDMDGMMGDCCA